MQRAADMFSGCLPPACPHNVLELREMVGTMTSSEMEQWNPPCDEHQPTICAAPYHIIGLTKDEKVAYYGLNHISSMSREKMERCLDTSGVSGRDKLQLLTAKRELDMLFAR